MNRTVLNFFHWKMSISNKSKEFEFNVKYLKTKIIFIHNTR